MQTTAQEADVIRLLTVHGAEGLEFEVVIVPDLAAGCRTGKERFVLQRPWGLSRGVPDGLHRQNATHTADSPHKERGEGPTIRGGEAAALRGGDSSPVRCSCSERATLESVPVCGSDGRANFFEQVRPGAIDRARQGRPPSSIAQPGTGLFREMLSAEAFTRPEHYPLNIDIAAVSRETIYREFQELTRAIDKRPSRRISSVEMTPSDLAGLRGCFRYFQWTRLLGLIEPGTQAAGGRQLHLGSIVHDILESGLEPSLELLREKGVPDLQTVFQSKEWQSLSKSDVARELPFIMHMEVGGRECFVRGRMDAVISGNPPRVIDYKYAPWREGAESEYEVQMASYCLAVMMRSSSERAVAELWFLKGSLRIVQQEFLRGDAERLIAGLSSRDICNRCLPASGLWRKGRTAIPWPAVSVNNAG